MNGNGKGMNGKKDMSMNGTCEHCGTCWCGGHHHGFGWTVVRVIVSLLIIGIVFSIGVMVGELKAFVGGWSSYGGHYPMMGGYYYGAQQGGQQIPQGYFPMMGGYYYGGAAQQTPTSTGR